MARRSDRRGFTLLEVLVGSGVLAITGLALAASLAQGHELAQSPREETLARNAIRSVLAELGAARFGDVARAFHGMGFGCPPLRPQRGDPDGLPGEIRFEYGPGGDRSCYTVTVRVRWEGRRGPRVVETVAYLSNVRCDTGEPVPLEEIVPSEGPPVPQDADAEVLVQGGER
jgi:prepilin-type N-terminal cleavage/methylation domain-containing protein